MRKQSKEDKQTIEQLETDTDDLAETLCTSKVNSLLILKTNSKRHTAISDWPMNECMPEWMNERTNERMNKNNFILLKIKLN